MGDNVAILAHLLCALCTAVNRYVKIMITNGLVFHYEIFHIINEVTLRRARLVLLGWVTV